MNPNPALYNTDNVIVSSNKLMAKELKQGKLLVDIKYIKTCVKRHLSKRPQIGFQDQLSLNAGQKYCRMLHVEHSAIHSTFIKLPVVIKRPLFSLF